MNREMEEVVKAYAMMNTEGFVSDTYQKVKTYTNINHIRPYDGVYE